MTKLSVRNTRVVVAAMEPRAGICSYDKASGKFTLTVPGQGVWGQKGQLVDILGVTPDKVRILTYNVGGSFGMKAPIYPEYVCLAHAARALGRPVKWTDERSGSFMSDHHGRDHEITGELALERGREVSGVKNDWLRQRRRVPQHGGAAAAVDEPGEERLRRLPLPAFEVSTKVCFTNTSPVSAYRGAGRPEANMYIERLIDEAAREMKIDRFELRRRNHVKPSEIPYKNRRGHDGGQRRLRHGVREGARSSGRKGFREEKRRIEKARQAARPRRRELHGSDRAAEQGDGRDRVRRGQAHHFHHRLARLRPGPRLADGAGALLEARRAVREDPPVPERFGQARVRRRHRRLAHRDDERRRGGAGGGPGDQEGKGARGRGARGGGERYRVRRRQLRRGRDRPHGLR